MINQTLAGAAADLMANQRPLLFLDTCDLVNLLQVLIAVPVPELQAVNRLLDALAANPQRCQPVFTYVTAVEFAQKTYPNNQVYIQDSAGKRMPPDEVAYQLGVIDAQLVRLHQVRTVARSDHLRWSGPSRGPSGDRRDGVRCLLGA
jgi:hypothetical protein